MIRSTLDRLSIPAPAARNPRTSRSRLVARCVLVYAAVFAIGIGWSLYANHTWEDYYITFRASKNLATGHGLTFTAGERVHSFTSPIGVLLPAVAKILSGDRNDYFALWIFRLMSIGAYAGAALILFKLARQLSWRTYSGVLLVVLFASDAKIVDFSTNGMETGFMVLFIAWALFALAGKPQRQSVHLGLAFAGLMWTRPDSVIYISVLTLGSLLFQPPAQGQRLERLKILLRAALLTAALYLPWFLWAWSYYGSPIPHTITAKGLFHPSTTIASIASAVWNFPRDIAAHRDILSTTFMPAYSFNTGWPALAIQCSFWVSAACMVVWLIPYVRPVVRLASFSFFWGQFYLTNYIEFPVPWYIPTLTLFAFVVIAGSVDQICSLVTRNDRPNALTVPRLGQFAAILITAAFAFGAIGISCAAAHQLKHQQIVIEHGQRREIGRWLRAHSSPRDTVFLEPLGYIGFYSNLKMLDYPGLSSPEVVAARRRGSSHHYPGCWPELIMDLSPTWLVLRSYEADEICRQTPELLHQVYTLARTFDVRDKVNAIPSIQGRDYLLNDALFETYRLNTQRTRDGKAIAGVEPIRTTSLTINQAWTEPAKDVGLKISAHAPSRLQLPRLPRAQWLAGSFGIEPGAYENPGAATDGAIFRILFVATSGEKREIFHRELNPVDRPADRGSQIFAIDLPENEEGKIEFEISAGSSGNISFDWTYWSFLRFELPGDS